MTIYRLIVQDSIEERILRPRHDKRDILEVGEVSARLSEEALREFSSEGEGGSTHQRRDRRVRRHDAVATGSLGFVQR
jgi:hypothetical protein